MLVSEKTGTGFIDTNYRETVKELSQKTHFSQYGCNYTSMDDVKRSGISVAQYLKYPMLSASSVRSEDCLSAAIEASRSLFSP